MQRQIVRIIQEIAQERGYDFQAYSGEWILRISKGEKQTHVFGYNFALNPSASQMIVQDKSAAATLLAAAGIPCVEHRLLMHPRMSKYFFPQGGNWQTLLNYFYKNGNRIVLKPANGTGGNSIYLATDIASLERAAHQLLEKNRAITLSPYLEIDTEHRIILLDNQVFTVYRKERPNVIGDEKKSLIQLIRTKYADSPHLGAYLSYIADRQHSTPLHGERVDLNWQHNLGQGAIPVIEREEALRQDLSRLAIQALSALNLRFASVDIVTVGGQRQVLEINSGVMGESLSKHSLEGYHIMRQAYESALAALLE